MQYIHDRKARYLGWLQAGACTDHNIVSMIVLTSPVHALTTTNLQVRDHAGILRYDMCATSSVS